MSHRFGKELIYINSDSADEMRKKHDIDRKLTELIIKERPFYSVYDFARNIEINKMACRKDYYKLMASAIHILPKEKPIVFIDKKEIKNKKGLVYGTGISTEKQIVVYIKDAKGNEVISSLIEKDDPNNIDIVSIRIYGMHYWEWSLLSPSSRNLLAENLRGEECKEVSLLWKELEKDGPKSSKKHNNKAVSLLSQILFHLVYFIRSETVRSETDCKTDGCTSSPDFNFEECCNQHDICYCIGGTEADKIRCDRQLAHCIRDNGMIILADLYRAAVENFADTHFNYHKEIPIVTFPPMLVVYEKEPEPQPRRSCRVIVELLQIQYYGNNIGNDWDFTIAADGVSRNFEMELNNDDLEPFADMVIMDKEIQNRCDTQFNILLSASAKEKDALWDDYGSNSIYVPVKCAGGVYESFIVPRLQVDVIEKKWHAFASNIAKLKFTFRITTRCAS
ncbi:hypothetical protein [Sulfurovum sp. AR]|uniref:hypothetical protein n=1 Tax=Sulfurovum sp. AR TaxID=1165841 RepID=UPI00025C4C40|nr:hypothetical protein [Sulfurovum sp. AR]EIF51040.1 hypothetical protein SULAR_06723 [Sulfurovum sp. AR]